MVVLTLTPYRGNHARSFPHAGFLGLTPVVIQGTVRTALEEDNKALKASELVVRVRCYETELGHRPKTRNGTGKATQVVYEQAQILWSKRSTDDWTELGDFQQAFRIVVPVDAVNAVSTSTFRNYRSWWQVEAGQSAVEKFQRSQRSCSADISLVRRLTSLQSFHTSPQLFMVPASLRRTRSHLFDTRFPPQPCLHLHCPPGRAFHVTVTWHTKSRPSHRHPLQDQEKHWPSP